MVRSILAVFAGYCVILFLIIVVTILASLFMLPPTPEQKLPAPTTAYLIVNLLYSTIIAGVGGWVTARFAQYAPLIHTGVLSLVFIFLGFLMALLKAADETSTAASQPSWYPFVVTLLGGIGVMAGGYLRLWQVQKKSETISA